MIEGTKRFRCITDFGYVEKENDGYYVSDKTLHSIFYIYLFLFYIDFTIKKQDCKMDHTPSLPIIFFFLASSEVIVKCCFFFTSYIFNLYHGLTFVHARY